MLLIRGGAVLAATSLRVAGWRLLCVVLLMFAGAMASVAHAEEDFLDPDVAFVFSAAMVNPTEIHLHLQVAPKYYLYRERFEFLTDPEPSSDIVRSPIFPPGKVVYDPTFEKDMEVYYQEATVRLPLAAGRTEPFTLTVVHQGCADAGLCYPPKQENITLTPVANGYTASGKGIVASVPAPLLTVAVAADPTSSGFTNALSLNDTGLATHLLSAGWVEVILLAFLFGMLLSFTPCVLPMVPILLAILAGDQGGGASPAARRWRGFALAAMFVLGMSLVYTVLGVAAGLIGASMAVWLQTPWVLTIFALLLALFALAMFDVFTLQTPTGMQTALNAWMGKLPGGQYGAVFLMGMVSAVIVGPCVAAPLAGVLLFISQTGDLVLGGTALFSMAWGEGIILLAVGASSGALMPKAGPWMNRIKYLFGVLLLATAWWMVNSLLPAWLMMLGWAGLALLGAVILGTFSSIETDAGLGGLLGKVFGLLLALWAVLLVIGVFAGGRDVLQPLAPFTTSVVGMSAGVATGSSPVMTSQGAVAVPQFTKVASIAELDALLATTSQPVMLDFYADWCVSCIEMERFTFSNPDVAKRMAEMQLLQADVTKNTPEDRALLKRFNLFGPPGIIFFDAQGQLRPNERVVGFQNAEKFLTVLNQVK